MRIFELTATFINLLMKTFKSILGFLILLIVALIACGNLYYLLHQWRIKNSSSPYSVPFAPIYSEELDNYPFINSIIYSYKLSLGDFDTENYAEAGDRSLLWVLFVLGTLILQITLLNMLIAIMGDTFDEVMETKLERTLIENY